MLSREAKDKNLAIRASTQSLRRRLEEDAQSIFGITAAQLWKELKRGGYRENPCGGDIAVGFELLASNSLPEQSPEGRHKAATHPDLIRGMILY